MGISHSDGEKNKSNRQKRNLFNEIFRLTVDYLVMGKSREAFALSAPKLKGVALDIARVFGVARRLALVFLKQLDRARPVGIVSADNLKRKAAFESGKFSYEDWCRFDCEELSSHGLSVSVCSQSRLSAPSLPSTPKQSLLPSYLVGSMRDAGARGWPRSMRIIGKNDLNAVVDTIFDWYKQNGWIE